jgi:hypothetical protein
MSRQSFAVKAIAADIGTWPVATTPPFTFMVTLRGPPGLSTAYAVSTSIFTLPIGSFCLARILVRWMGHPTFVADDLG